MQRILQGVVAGVLLAVCFGAVAGDKEDERIKGVSDFLIKRAKENYFYIFEKKIRDNKALQCYFPTTYSYVEEGDLKLLLTSRGIWGDSIKKDLDTLVARAFAKQLAEHFHHASMDATNFYLEIMQYLSVTVEGQPYPVTVMPVNANEQVRNAINGLYDDFLSLRKLIEKKAEDLAPFVNICQAPEISIDEIKQVIKGLQDVVQGLDAWSGSIAKYKDSLKVNVDALEHDCAEKSTAKICQIKDKIRTQWLPVVKQNLEQPLVKAAAASVFLTKYVHDVQQADKNTGKVLVVIKGLRASGLDKTVDLDKFKHHLLFFAQISDAEKAEEVSALLGEYTLPAVSFFVKREKNTSHILLSAFLGYGYGTVLNDSKAGTDNKSGVMAPLGLEFSYGTRGEGAWSILLAPFDFGYPVSLKLHGITENVDYDEIVAPGIYLSYGVPEYPLNVGLAYQQGRKVGAGIEAENRALFFVSFDMPLLTLY